MTLSSEPSILPAFRCNACRAVSFWINITVLEGQQCRHCKEGILVRITLYVCPSCANESEDRATIMECMRSHDALKNSLE